MPLHSYSGILTPVAPFDFAQSLNFIGGFAPAHGEQTLAERALTKAVIVNRHPLVFEIRSTGTVEQPSLTYRLWAAQPIDADLRRALEERLRFFLSLDDDLESFYALTKADPAFAPVVRQLYGLRQVKFLTPFELACWAVLVQRTPMPISIRMKKALVDKYGASLSVNGETYWAFPEVHTLAALSPADFNAVIGHARKAEYLSAVAQAFATVEEHWLRTAPVDDVCEWLLAIKGIGAFSANFILIRGLGRMEQLTSIEPELQKAIARHYDAALAESLAERYGPYRGYWAHYLRVAG